MLLPTSAADTSAGRPRARRAASLLAALALSYAVVLCVVDVDDLRGLLDYAPFATTDPPRRRRPVRRSLQVAGSEYDARILAKNGHAPFEEDEVPGEYIIKPWVGTAQQDVWEQKSDTKLELESAQSSSEQGAAYTPRYAIDDPSLSTRWASDPESDEDFEWVNIDMGGPHNVAEIYIKWFESYAQNYQIFVSRERQNCRSDGRPCPDHFVKVVDVTGKSDASATSDSFEDEDFDLQGVRYVRVKMNTKAPGHDNFSFYYIRVYRRPLIVGETPTGVSCGGTTAAAASSLLGTHGGTLIQTYPTAEFFAASMTESQKEDMLEDPCVFTVEPNYVVQARGRAARQRRGDARRNKEEHQRRVEIPEMDKEHRRLAIPEFNLRDESPASWGLERISSHGRLNGKYTWIHEALGVHIYVFDTGIYPDNVDFQDRDGVTRLGDGLICAGAADDYDDTHHGTHVASLAAGFDHGVAKSAIIHPIQVLGSDDTGTTASVLCGMERLLQDGIAYNAANAPKKIRAVVLLSLGVNGRSDALDKAVEDMTAVGYTVVIAAGNENDNACFYSPHHEDAITVGALSNHELGENSKTPSSNYGECIDLWAPGEDIAGASNTGEFDSVEMSGTSVAAAFAAGAAALFFEEVFTEPLEMEDFSAKVKDKIMSKAEIGILDEIGHMSPNKNLQTTAVRCLVPQHCAPGLTCLFDGTCWDMSKPLGGPKLA